MHLIGRWRRKTKNTNKCYPIRKKNLQTRWRFWRTISL